MALRYWNPGGFANTGSKSGNWNDTNSWAQVAAGAAGFSVPTSADDVIIDTITSTSYTVNVNVSASCKSLVITTSSTPLITISGTSSISISGTTAGGTHTGNYPFAIYVTGVSITVPSISFNGAGVQSIYTSNRTLNCTISTSSGIFLNNLGNGGDLIVNGLGFTHSGGTITLNGNNIYLRGACPFVSSSGTRSIAFGSNYIFIDNQNTFTNATVATNYSINIPNLTTYTFTGTGGFSIENTYSRRIGLGYTSGGSSTTGPNVFFYLDSSNNITVDANSWFNIFSFNGAGTGNILPTSVAVNVNTLGFATKAPRITPTFRGTGILQSNGISFSNPITINAPAGTITIADALTTTSSITHTAGTLNTNNFSISCSTFSSSNANTRTLALGKSTFTLTGSGSPWDITTTTGLTFSGTSTISLSSATAKTFTGGGFSYFNIQNTGTGALTITGSNSFNDISAPAGSTITLTSGTTQTFRYFTLKGSTGSLITLNSSTAGTQASLARNSNTNMLSTDYLSITDIATIGGTWYAGINSTNVSNNTGWSFTVPPDPTGNLLALFVP